MKNKPAMTIWIGGDLHFLHDNLIKPEYCSRPKDHSQKIFDGLMRIPEKDLFICLGDISIGRELEVYERFIKPLKCRKILVKGNHDKKCLSKNTRLLTKEGYKYYHELQEGEPIPTVNLDTGKVEYNPINNIYTYSDVPELYIAKSRSGKMEVTNHHVVINQLGSIKKSTKWKKQLAENLWNTKTSFKVPVAFSSDSNQPISDNYLKLMAWIMTDGSILPSGKVIIYQSKQNYIKEIKELLNNMNISFKEKVRNREIKKIAGKIIKSSLPQHIFNLDLPQSRQFLKDTKLKSKYKIPECLWHLSDTQFNTFIIEMVKGDGTFKNGGTKVLWGKREFLLQVMGLCVTHNVSANIRKQTNRPNFYLSIRKKNSGKQFDQRHTSIKPYNDTAWCVNVKNNVIFVELEGNTFVTGNSNNWYLTHGWDFVCYSFHDTYRGKKVLFSHYPICTDDYDFNIHGHLHNNIYKFENLTQENREFVNEKHLLFAMELTKYQPMKLDYIIDKADKFRLINTFKK